MVFGFEYGYNWPVYQTGKLSIQASVGASINSMLPADDWAFYAILLGMLGVPRLSADAALIMDCST